MFRDQRGAVFVEYNIVLIPVLFFFFCVWQIAELSAASIVVRRAASAAARAAMVVLPDDPHYYDVPENSFSGQREQDIRRAAGLVLAAAPAISSDFRVSVNGELSGYNGQFTVEVAANYHCAGGGISLVCGFGGVRQLKHTVAATYHGAKYGYDAYHNPP